MNTTTNERVAWRYTISDSMGHDPWDLLIVVNFPYDSEVDPFNHGGVAGLFQLMFGSTMWRQPISPETSLRLFAHC